MTDRWARLSEIVDIDLNEAKNQLQAFESDLEAAKAQLDSLGDYALSCETDITKPGEYQSVQTLTRQKQFLDSLKDAIGQQNQVIAAKEQKLEHIREQVIALYQKKESYLVISRQNTAAATAAADKKEADFLDDLRPFSLEDKDLDL